MNDAIFAVIPGYNEEKNIRSVISEVKNYVSKIIVVDDGSRDNTSKEAEKEGRGVAIMDEKFIGPPILISARKTLKKHELILNKNNHV